MSSKLTKFILSEEGATAVEYGLVIAVLAVALLAVFNGFVTGLGGWFDSLITDLMGIEPTAAGGG